jgi:hypothetical protein
LRPIATGSAIGFATALWSGQYLAHLVEGVESISFQVCAAAALGLIVAGLISAWAGTLRLWRVDPVTALRSE